MTLAPVCYSPVIIIKEDCRVVPPRNDSKFDVNWQSLLTLTTPTGRGILDQNKAL